MSQYPLQQKISLLDLIWKFKFLLVFYIAGISCLTFIILYSMGGVPTELKMADTSPSTEEVASTITTNTASAAVVPTIRPGLQTFLKPAQTTVKATDVQGELPTHIFIDKIGVNTVISNTSSTKETTLDSLLTKGAVRYPGSGTLGHGNMFLFGHSTSIKIVNNQAYKAFNGVKNLNIGDIIRIQSTTKEYTYKVTSVSLVDSDKEYVDLKTDENMVTISTCNVLGEKQERFVVEAVFEKTTNI